MVFGTNALITKPAISIAPMITVALLNRHGYEYAKNSSPMPDGYSTVDLHSCMFHLLVVTPIAVGLLQLFIWSRYTIRDSHLEVSKYTEGDET